MDHYRAALRMGAGRDEAALNAQLGELLERSGDIAGAVRHYREALRADSEFQGVREHLARAQVRLQRESGGLQ
jgi:predicted TPR repeat methyltransferase